MLKHAPLSQPDWLTQHFPPFATLETNELIGLQKNAREVHCRRGDVPMHKDDDGNHFFIVIRGQVKLVLNSSLGGEKVLSILESGSTFGLHSMFLKPEHIIFAQTTRDSVLVQLARPAITKLAQTNLLFANALIGALAQCVGHLLCDIESYSLRTSKQRVMAFLYQLLPANCNDNSMVVTLPAHKGLIASRLNLTQEHFSRVLNEMHRDELMTINGAEVTLHDIKRLVSLME